MINALTIDLEDWYQTKDFNFNVNTWDNFDDRIVNSTSVILELLEKHNVHGTFFVLGWIAKKHPGLVKRISDGGHEIGSHGRYHTMVSDQTESGFRKDLLCSKQAIEDITGKEVRLFRAPSWSINRKTLWALPILEEEGFICDSSIQPFKTPLSGMNKVPVYPFHPVIDNRRLKLVEFPSCVIGCGNFGMPFSGGFYLRFSPYFFISQALKTVGRKRPGMVYVHPWEVDIKQPRIDTHLHVKLIHYYNLKTTYNKLDRLLDDFEFMPLGKVIKMQEYSYVPLL